MPQITLYLDADTEAMVNAQAKASGQSKSRWVAELIRRHAHDQWPDSCRALAGKFPDFPLREDAPAQDPANDVQRIGF
ncbi:hypothetical protein SAMN05192555_103152 [Franzmannia pantelleriensis]|uniref:Ribbon-helix-helix protein, copG family n=1 Tax=Franzmannia pantelleriensis TaxID=48727 RepID=A0A1G9IFI6_9GAMM|nr:MULTISPECIES: CopG family transcriptional regulator [Halomonas]SDL23614.1 hypothetical protein SAMN05192555_103152 [Halomonas pantelleriensis]